MFNVFLDACLINNFVLAYFLGLCPFMGVSGKLDTALRMGGAVTFVMLIASASAFVIHQILQALGAPFLQLIAYIVVIASTVQLLEMAIKRFSPALFDALGIFLPLITTNCAILGLTLFQTSKGYDFIYCLTYALGAGSGFTLVLILMAGLREELDLTDTPKLARGTALTLLVAGVMSLAFMGFAGLGG
jgi:electron transport complex protein RnfA